MGVIKLCKDILQKSQVEETFSVRGEKCIFVGNSSRALGHRIAPLRSVSDTRSEGLEPKKLAWPRAPALYSVPYESPRISCLILGTCLRLAWTSYLPFLERQTPFAGSAPPTSVFKKRLFMRGVHAMWVCLW